MVICTAEADELEAAMVTAGDAVATEARPAKRAAVEYFILKEVLCFGGFALNEGWQVLIVIERRRRRSMNTDR